MDIVTVADYRVLTNDLSTDDPTVSARLEFAVGLVQEGCDRFLQLDTYTEQLWLHTDWVVYPHGVPITSVTTPSGAAPVNGGYAITGSDVGLWWDPVVGPLELWRTDPFTTVTYTGGFTYDTLPPGLRLIICDVALALGQRAPALTSAAVQSASVADVSVSYGGGGTGIGSVDGVLPGTSVRLTAYRRPTS